jgi:hypothetical protein
MPTYHTMMIAKAINLLPISKPLPKSFQPPNPPRQRRWASEAHRRSRAPRPSFAATRVGRLIAMA